MTTNSLNSLKASLVKLEKELASRNLDISKTDISIYVSVSISKTLLKAKKNIELFSVLFDENYSDLIKRYEYVNNKIPQCITDDFISKLEKADREIFDSPNIISWAYQFLKKDLADKAFSQVGENKNKISGSDLLHTTQFFTDDYMVEYLVSKAISRTDIKELKNTKFIDVACGGGNFLTATIDYLFDLYKNEYPDLDDQSIINSILLNNIVGYDLDPTLSKIASLSVFTHVTTTYCAPSKEIIPKIYGGLPDDNLGYLASKVRSNVINGKTFSDELKRDNKKSNFIYLTNPPFMGKRDMDSKLKNYLQNKFPKSKGDLCVSFIEKLITEANEGDSIHLVSQDNWLFLVSLGNFRKFVLENASIYDCIDLGSNAFYEINGEKTSVMLCSLDTCNKRKGRFVNLKDKDRKQKIKKLKNISKSNEYHIELSAFLKNKNYEFNYELESNFNSLDLLPTYGKFALPMQGTSTGNNKKFVKYSWEVNGNKNWVPVSKGGGFSRWAGLNFYRVLWGENGELVKNNEGSAIRNLSKIEKTDLVFSDTGTLGLNVRILKENQVFIASGPGIITFEGSKFTHLAFLNSKVASFLLKKINPKFTISAGYLKKIPVPESIFQSSELEKKAKNCIKHKNEILSRKLPNQEFLHVDYQSIENTTEYFQKEFTKDLNTYFKLLTLESEINEFVISKYNFNSKDLDEYYKQMGKPVRSLKLDPNLCIKSLDKLLSSILDVNCFFKSKRLEGALIGTDNLIEYLSYQFSVHPKTVVEYLKENISKLEKTKQIYIKDLLHKITLKSLGLNYINDNLSKNYLDEDIFKKITAFCSPIEDLEITELSLTNLKEHHKKSFLRKPILRVDI